MNGIPGSQAGEFAAELDVLASLRGHYLVSTGLQLLDFSARGSHLQARERKKIFRRGRQWPEAVTPTLLEVVGIRALDDPRQLAVRLDAQGGILDVVRRQIGRPGLDGRRLVRQRGPGGALPVG